MNEMELQHKKPCFSKASIGIIAGIAEVAVNHPLWVIKARMQSNYKPILQLKGIYHGLCPNMVSMVPLIALRLSLATILNEGCLNKKEEFSSYKLILSAFVGGGIPSLLSSPLELVRTNQISKGLNFISTYKSITKKNGLSALFVGMPGTIIRDGLYTCGFFALAPIFKNKLDTYINSDEKWISSVLSKPLAGAVAAFSSQPLDTIKGKQQIAIKAKENSFMQVTKEIITQEGVYGFFKGSTPRILRVISGITIISTINENLRPNGP